MEYKEENLVWQLAVHLQDIARREAEEKARLEKAEKAKRERRCPCCEMKVTVMIMMVVVVVVMRKKMRKSPNEIIFQAYPEDSVTLGDFHYHKVFVSHVQHFST